MADVVSLFNMTELTNEVSAKMLASVSPLITIFKAVGIALLVYIIFLIIKSLFRWRTMGKIGKISRNVQQINEKLDILISKKVKEKTPEPGKTEKKKKREK